MRESDEKLKILLELRAKFRMDNPSLKLSVDAAAIQRIKELEDKEVEREATGLRLQEIENVAIKSPATMARILAEKYNAGIK